MPSLTSATVLDPSDLVDYLDTKRTMSLLYDEGELDDDEEPASIDDIDDNSRAVTLARAAWSEVLAACRRGNIYLQRELVDLANDSARGQYLVELVADIFWCKLVKRRRYVQGDPQAEDPACQRAQEKLEMLRRGERIFVLDDVVSTDTGGGATGVYSDSVSKAGAISVGTFGQTNLRRPDNRFWGCVSNEFNDSLSGGSGSNCGCG